MRAPVLPEGVTLFERGWLSSNCILLTGAGGPSALVDSGYHTHADQTLGLVATALAGRHLDLIVNTHLHSDHCGGNSALQQRYPAAHTRVPAAQFDAVRNWDTSALSYEATGQGCPRFRTEDPLRPGTETRLGDRVWQIHGAPGHDPHSIILFEPAERILVSADALWANGFGVVFPELDGHGAFDEVGSTLDLIERLRASVVIPGHGSAFTDISAALNRARTRLESFQKNPARHARHGAKVLLKFKLLEWQQVNEEDLLAWAARTPYFHVLHRGWFAASSFEAWVSELLDELVQVSAVSRNGDGQLRND